MKIVCKAINISSTLTWYFCMIEKSEELWLILIVHFISKRNDSENIILSGTIHDRVSVLFNLLPLVSANILKLLVK